MDKMCIICEIKITHKKRKLCSSSCLKVYQSNQGKKLNTWKLSLNKEQFNSLELKRILKVKKASKDPEVRSKRIAGLMQRWASKDFRDAHNQRNRDNLKKPGFLENRNKAIKNAVTEEFRERQKAASLKNSLKGTSHPSAVKIMLRSPVNIVYHINCLKSFVKNNEHLFHESEVIWRLQRGSRSAMRCIALNGLYRLISINDRSSTWKGWTVVSDVEIKSNHGEDLIHRDVLEK